MFLEDPASYEQQPEILEYPISEPNRCPSSRRHEFNCMIMILMGGSTSIESWPQLPAATVRPTRQKN